MNFEEIQEKNSIHNTDIYFYHACESVHIPKNMTPEELTNLTEVYIMNSIT